MKNILITGANGMLGSALQKEITSRGKYVLPHTRKVSDLGVYDSEHRLESYIEKNDVDSIIHCAAKVGGVMANMNSNSDFFRENVAINNEILETALKYGVKNLVSILSTCIFPNENITYPLTADQLDNGKPHDSNSGYSYAKRLLYYQTKMYREFTGNNWISIVPTNLYGACFSSDTEVLTPNGIKNIKDIVVGDVVYGLNPNTHEVEIEKVTHTQKVRTSEFINFKGRSVDFKVTPDHKMYYKTNNNSYIKRTADYFRDKMGKEYGQIEFATHSPIKEDIQSYDEINLIDYKDDSHILLENNMIKDSKHSNSKDFPLNYNLDDIVEFIGWYVSEGSVIKNSLTKGGINSKNGIVLESGLYTGQIRISQSKEVNEENYKKIDSLLERMKIPYGKDENSFYFTSRLFRNYLGRNFGIGSENKKLSSFIFNLDYRRRRLLFDTMMKGDGDKKGGRYSTKSINLKNDFIHLCFTLGIKNGGSTLDNGCYRISIRNIRSNTTVKYKNITNEYVDDNAYCITTEKNHIIYAGRNDMFNWIGQCDNYHLENSHLIPALIRKAYEASLSGEKFYVWGDGTPLRQFLYSEDLSKVILYAIENWKSDKPFMAVNPIEYSIKDVATIIADRFDLLDRIEYQTDKPSGQFRKPASTDIPSDFEFTSLEEGLNKSIDWFIANYDTCRK